MIINGKSLDCRLGIQTQDRKMEGADESTELWRHPASRIIIVGLKLTNDQFQLQIHKINHFYTKQLMG